MFFGANLEKHKKIVKEKGLVTNHSSKEYSKIVYALPLPQNKITEVTVKGSGAHVGNLSNSIDFYVPVGTEVFAAANGVVVETKDDSNIGGPDTKYWNDGNFIIIEHDEEYTQYEHLKFRGVLVRVGDAVKQGQVIGYSGNTGYTPAPHLHFEVQKYFDETDYVTLKARFKNFRDVYSE